MRYEVAGPGFVNLFLSDDWHRRALRTVLDAGERFGAGGAAGRRAGCWWSSSRPTRPARWSRPAAATPPTATRSRGSSQHHGHEVWREYYFNDAGSQIRRLGESVLARARGEDVPEGGYQGEYVRDAGGADPRRGGHGRRRGVGGTRWQLLLAQIKATLERYGVHYDQFFSERTLHEGSPSYLDRALEVGRRGRQLLRVRRGAVAAHDELRRRQGPGAAPLRRRADLSGRRCRLPAAEARARRRAAAACRWAPTITATWRG